jgi:5-formyltetrahydrofolate cyclo-ligase
MSLSSPNLDKAALRRTLRQARAAVPDAVRRMAARQVERQALSHRLIASQRRVGFYMPAKGELDCLPLLNRALWLGAECYLPIVPHYSQRKLWFTRLRDGRHWAVNRFGIPEFGHRHDKYRAAWLDVLFMPLLGFDRRGYRMGMGGGFYDASLAFLGRQRRWRRPRLIGLAFEAQRVERLPEDPWDIPLDGVLTEKRFYRFNNGRPSATPFPR